MVLQGAGLGVNHHHGCSGGQWQLVEERGGGVDMEESLGEIWALEDVVSETGGGVALPLPALLCRRTSDEAVLEVGRVQRQPQNYCDDGVPSQGSFARNAGKCWNGGLGSGGGEWCGVAPAGGQIGAGSPKSSISSDASGGDTAGGSPAGVWEVGGRTVGASRGGRGGGDAGSGEHRKKRPLAAADGDGGGRWKPPQTSCSLTEHSDELRNTEQSVDALKQLFFPSGTELRPPLLAAGEEGENQLLERLMIISFERDEAREQLQRLLNKLAPPSAPEQSVSHLQVDPLFYYPYVSSPVETPTDPAELPHEIMADTGAAAAALQPHQDLFPHSSSSIIPPTAAAAAAAALDPASAIIDCLVAEKALPAKGKLLQAVMEAGPLLQTLLVAGPLPRWRNPPPPMPCQIPPVTLRSREGGIFNQDAVLSHQNHPVHGSSKGLHLLDPVVASQIIAASATGSSCLGAFRSTGPTPSICAASSYQGTAGKRQRFQ